MFGSVLFIFPLWIGGFLQGLQWANWATGTSYAEFHNNISEWTFLQSIGDMHYWWMMRSIGGVIIASANLLFIYNMFNTILLKPIPIETRSKNEELEMGKPALAEKGSMQP